GVRDAAVLPGPLPSLAATVGGKRDFTPRGGAGMNLLAIGCSYRTTPVEVREKFAFNDEQLGRALEQLTVRLGCEAVILSTCNRVEVYIGIGESDSGAELPHFLADFHALPRQEVRQHL